MVKVTQIIPAAQVQIIKDSLDLLEVALKSLRTSDSEVQHKLFDIMTLKAMLNGTKVIIELPMYQYDNFTADNGVDFPEYTI